MLPHMEWHAWAAWAMAAWGWAGMVISISFNPGLPPGTGAVATPGGLGQCSIEFSTRIADPAFGKQLMLHEVGHCTGVRYPADEQHPDDIYHSRDPESIMWIGGLGNGITMEDRLSARQWWLPQLPYHLTIPGIH